MISSAYPSPVADHYSDEQEDYSVSGNKPRRRREMQAITKIVETREFPYVDNYFWKNNGNTVQKKTGCKSIYYKCSNSNKVIFFGNITGYGGEEKRVCPIYIWFLTYEIHAWDSHGI